MMQYQSLFKPSTISCVSRLVIVILMLGRFWASPVNAGFVHLSRLSEQNNGIITNVSPISTNWLAAQFRVGSEIPSTTLSELRLIVEQGVAESTYLATLGLSVFTDMAGTPDQNLTPGPRAFTNGGSITGTGVARFTSSTPLTLFTGEFYWLVLRPKDDQAAPPEVAQWSTMQAPIAWPISVNSDSVWNLAAIPASQPAINVPEPSASLLGAAGALLFGFLVRGHRPLKRMD